MRRSKRRPGQERRPRADPGSRSRSMGPGRFCFVPFCVLSSCRSGSACTIPVRKSGCSRRPPSAVLRGKARAGLPLRMRWLPAVPTIRWERTTCRERGLPRRCPGAGKNLILHGRPPGPICHSFCWRGCSCSEWRQKALGNPQPGKPAPSPGISIQGETPCALANHNPL